MKKLGELMVCGRWKLVWLRLAHWVEDIEKGQSQEEGE